MVFSCTDDVATGLKDALTHCYKCKGRKVSLSDHEDSDEKLIGDFNYDHEVNKLKTLLPIHLLGFHFQTFFF